jgi:DNA repair protein RecN (Recombination protein N)
VLSQIYIENIAVIEKSDIRFPTGFVALTGETGAGKSILIDAINAVLGERISKDIIRAGADSAFVSAVFEDVPQITVNALKAFDIAPEEDGTLLIQRGIVRDGRSNIKLNGKPATISILREVGRTLINMHGQHENQALLHVENHLHYLDKLADKGDLLEEYGACYGDFRKKEQELAKLKLNEEEKQRRIDVLEYQVNEISSASLREGEAAELGQRREYLANAELIGSCLQLSRLSLYGDEDTTGALALLHMALDKLGEAAGAYSELNALNERFSELVYGVEDVSEELRSSAELADYSPQELDSIEQRLDLISKIVKKYGGSEQAALEYLVKAEEELEGLQNAEAQAEKLQAELAALLSTCEERAVQLSQVRREAVKIFAGRVRSELTFLDMPNVRLAVSFRRTELTAKGWDAVEFLISANPGEEPKSIAKIASGGELSRIMLAIKNVLAEKDEIATLIFDEVDAGISGRAAFKVGKKLSEVSRSRQVICVTHLAQIAAQADSQLLIEKHVEEGRTYTEVKPLEGEAREREIARIIGGDMITEATLTSAREMLVRT